MGDWDGPAVPASPGVEGENVYEMFQRLGGAGFFVSRNSWTHPYTLARVDCVQTLYLAPLVGVGPYFNDAPVGATFCYQGVFAWGLLSCPGTGAYRVVPAPTWWPQIDRFDPTKAGWKERQIIALWERRSGGLTPHRTA